MPIETKRFKQIREELKLTQAAFAAQLGLSTTADIERGRVKLSGHIVKELLKKYRINPLWIYGESEQQYLAENRVEVSPKVVAVNTMDAENILLVHTKAAAGYAKHIEDPEFYESLPAFTFPLPEYRNATFRGFQVEGDSMMPAIKPGEWVLAKALQNFDEAKSGAIYIIVEEEGIRLKQLQFSKESESVTLISLNTDYPPVTLFKSEIKELWVYHSKVSFGMTEDGNINLQHIYNELQGIKKSLKKS